MSNRATELANEIRRLEKELRKEISRIRIDSYEIRDRSIRFKEEVARRHKAQMVGLFRYLRQARIAHILTTPIIWLCLVPAVLMDIVVTLFQLVCFPVYGIPKVRRRDHVIIDRHHLRYLNLIEKLNCMYCGYFNGVIAYVREVAARTEQYWCPIKHAAQLPQTHSRYHRFLDYGDADAYKKSVNDLRGDFSDLSDDNNNGKKDNETGDRH